MRYVRRRGRTCFRLHPRQRTNEGPHNPPTESSRCAWAPLRADETSSRAINGRGIVAKKRITPPRSKRLIHATMPVRTIDETADLVSRETALDALRKPTWKRGSDNIMSYDSFGQPEEGYVSVDASRFESLFRRGLIEPCSRHARSSRAPSPFRLLLLADTLG